MIANVPDWLQWLNDASSFRLLFDFVFYYPLFMAWLWMIGGLWYYLVVESKDSADPDFEPNLKLQPRVSILVPCYNEEENVEEVVASLDKLHYPDFEIICINDGSKDRTGELLDAMLDRYPRLRVIHQNRNQGKAVALNTAAPMASGEFLLCIDGDAILDPHIVPWMLRHFEQPRVAAVTGNPRIRTRSTLLGRIQVGEFSSIIGLIKRAQRTYGRVFTVSGVVVAFRRTAMHHVGYWSPEMLTEDIDISWKLQTSHWEIRFEPRALAWILMPETVKGLWSQRLRWAMGGVQVVIKYAGIMTRWRQRRMWIIWIEYLTSVTWAYAMLSVFVMFIATHLVHVPDAMNVRSVLPAWHGIIIGSTCLMQFWVSLMIDRRYEPNLMKYYLWLVWYPLVYWMLTALTSVWAVPKVLFRTRGKRAVWVSPDRGVQSGGQSKP